MTDTLLFDLDNTILDFNKAERIALTRALGVLGIQPTQRILARYSAINLAQWKRLERGEITRAQVKLGRFQLFFDELGFKADPRAAASLYEGFLAEGHYFMEGAEDLLEALAGKYRLYLVTNGTARVQHGRIASAGLERYFQGIFISEEIGHNKPSREYFDACFAQIPAFSRERTVLIGDSLTSDIQGGRNAELRTVWFNPAGEAADPAIRPDVEIRKLSELPEVLERW